MTRVLLLAAAFAAQTALAINIFGIETDPDKIEAGWKKEKLEALANDRDPKERAAAAEWLGGRDDADAIAALAAALSDPEPKVRQAAASGLWSTGKSAASARPQLMKTLDDADPNVVAQVTGALEAIGMKEAELVAPNKRVFNSPGATIDSRFLVSRSLIGREPATKILEAQLAYLADNASSRSDAGKHNTELAQEALVWLAQTQDRSLGAPLVEAARTARAGQPAILKAIDELKQKPTGLAQVATALLDSPDKNVRYAALGTMRNLTAKSDVDVWAPRAAALVRDPESLVRGQALIALGYGGGFAADQIDKVVEALGDRDESVRRRAAEAIGRMGDKTQAVAAASKARVAAVGRPALTAIVDSDPDDDVRREARGALAKLGAGGGAAVAPSTSAGSAARGSEASGLAVLRARGVTFEQASFMRALMDRDVELVRAFLDAGMSPRNPLADDGPPIRLMLFGDSCHPRERPTNAETKTLVKLLLDRGADPNIPDANGNTALMEASSRGCDRELMRTLIKAGAKIDVKNKAGLTPFEMGLLWGHDGLEELIAAGYRLPPDKVKQYEQGYAGKPAVQAMIKKASRK